MGVDNKFIFPAESQKKVIENGILTEYELEYLKELLDKANKRLENTLRN